MGLASIGNYGSVAAEIAVCTKAAGLVDRSSLRQLAVTGPEPLLDHVLEAALPDGAPPPGRAVCVASTWCCRSTARRAIVAGAPSAVERWRQVESRAVSSAGLAVEVTLLPRAGALTLVGPRAAGIVAAVGLPDRMRIREVSNATLAGTQLTLLREDGDSFLALFERGDPPPAVFEALWAAGSVYGMAPVGTEALALLRAAHRPIG
jgi:glycine cleavage system aminomethyltransferase T